MTSAMTSVPCGERRDVVPRAEPSIDLRVVDRIEAGVGAVDRMEERQHVDAAERAGERTVEQPLQIAERAAREAIDVGDQLRLILHREVGNPSVRMVMVVVLPLAQILVEPADAGRAHASLRRIIAA